jgi:hypothetical protein
MKFTELQQLVLNLYILIQFLKYLKITIPIPVQCLQSADFLITISVHIDEYESIAGNPKFKKHVLFPDILDKIGQILEMRSTALEFHSMFIVN